ncbi:SRPBCC family protein [Ornithinimicrobium sp. W1665]|uniref:SRPBCC family protein n=1 Tax=Ornithinimicrobium sp. W1665 TaxID=3416666 RepID=UPI003D6B0BBD
MTEVDAPHRLAFDDGFADGDLNPVDTAPVARSVFTFEAVDGGTRAVYTSTYDTAEALQQVLDMGVVEGATTAINQIDGLLAA